MGSEGSMHEPGRPVCLNTCRPNFLARKLENHARQAEAKMCSISSSTPDNTWFGFAVRNTALVSIPVCGISACVKRIEIWIIVKLNVVWSGREWRWRILPSPNCCDDHNHSDDD